MLVTIREFRRHMNVARPSQSLAGVNCLFLFIFLCTQHVDYSPGAIVLKHRTSSAILFFIRHSYP